jgi:hypothetical protein
MRKFSKIINRLLLLTVLCAGLIMVTSKNVEAIPYCQTICVGNMACDQNWSRTQRACVPTYCYYNSYCEWIYYQ